MLENNDYRKFGKARTWRYVAASNTSGPNVHPAIIPVVVHTGHTTRILDHLFIIALTPFVMVILFFSLRVFVCGVLVRIVRLPNKI